MKKWFLFLLVVLLVAAGCSNNGGEKKEDKAANAGSEQKTTIKMLTHWDAANTEAFKQLIKEYETANPGVKIDLQTVPFGDLLKKITTSKLAGDGPDIYHIYSAWLPELVKSNSVGKAPDFITSDINSGYLDNIKKSVSMDGVIYGYPTELTTYALNYNKRLFAEAGLAAPPKNWQELVEFANKLTKKEGGQTVQQGFGVISGWDSGVVHPWLALLQSNGGKFLTDDNKKAAFNSKEGIEAIELYKTMLDSGAINPQMSPSNASTTGGYQNNFELEKTAMIVMANWWKGGLQSTMKEKFNNVATAPIPVGPSGSKPVSVFYSWLYTVNSQSKNQEAAWKFLQWVNSPKGDGQSSRQGDWLMNQGILPSRTSDQTAHKNTLENDAFVKTYVELLKDAKPFPIVNKGAEMTAALQKQIEAVLFSKADPKSALKTAEEEINNLLSK